MCPVVKACPGLVARDARVHGLGRGTPRTPGGPRRATKPLAGRGATGIPLTAEGKEGNGTRPIGSGCIEAAGRTESVTTMSDAVMPTTYFLASVDRVMQVLDAFTSETPELRLTDLSDRLGIPKPQVLRIAATLERGGYLNRDPDTKRYRLGIRLFQLGMLVRQQIDLRRVAQPCLRTLADETLETVGLFVPDATGPICIDVIESPKGLRVFAQLGRRMPWNAGTSAKVILAFLPEERRERILARGNFERYTARTITEAPELRAVLDEIRRTGYHLGIGDLDEHAIGVAAPIFDDGETIAGAISVAAPVTRLSEDDLPWLIDRVRQTAATISRQLGHHPAASASAADD